MTFWQVPPLLFETSLLSGTTQCWRLIKSGLILFKGLWWLSLIVKLIALRIAEELKKVYLRVCVFAIQRWLHAECSGLMNCLNPPHKHRAWTKISNLFSRLFFQVFGNNYIEVTSTRIIAFKTKMWYLETLLPRYPYF
jgi:hypothetical protein